MYFHFGRVTAVDFEEYLDGSPDPCLEVSGLESAVTIPFLTARPGGQPMYSLALAMFYDKDRRDFPKTNLIYPYIPVDDIRLDEEEAYVKDGEEEFRVSLLNQVPCQPPPSLVRYRLQDFINMNVQFGVPEPDFSFCDRHPMENRFCKNARKIGCTVHRHVPNICQIWLSDDQRACQTSVEIENITQKFRAHFLQDDGPVTIVASETYFGNYSVGLKMPCVD
ncbi:hypothetical protein HOLleu_36355 [Holothuria leucospilota]|uniref:Uncharacterized protein n=1 Tax=Holothuria leucospilota TaxID=206669 RepID=A0A9Q1BDL5_HOLLE|nr:hypothetical protein HOLleu_36355 [Holothuria leucospilota]